ncbi:MAG: hypothetical protein EXQ91_07975 [Alphaproteobacteria bacterium]|nr:hypothetical protein [Alphaproteobacteria bacterium]
MHKLLLIGAVIVLFGVAGAGVFFLVLAPTNDGEKEKEAKIETPLEIPRETIEMKPFIVPVSMTLHTVVKIDLILKHKDSAARAKAALPKMRDALLIELYTLADKGGRAGGMQKYDRSSLNSCGQRNGSLGPTDSLT